MTASPTRKSASPIPALRPTPEEYHRGFVNGLKERFCLDPFEMYTILVEGHTDIAYLSRAAELAEEICGENLLAVPAYVLRADENPRIRVRTPENPLTPGRGGTKEVGRLARFLGTYVPILELTGKVFFACDHDEAGRGCLKAITEAGFDTSTHCLTLDPAKHPNACSKDDVVIEDLLSLTIQRRFFETGGCCGRVTYHAGEVVRYEWNDPSKSLLQRYVVEHAGWNDLMEIGRVIARIREVWGLPTNPVLFPR